MIKWFGNILCLLLLYFTIVIGMVIWKLFGTQPWHGKSMEIDGENMFDYEMVNGAFKVVNRFDNS